MGGTEPPPVVEPASVDEVAAELARARSERLAVLPRGRGTRPGCGAPYERVDEVLSTVRLSRILIYEPADLTVTVEAGCGLAELGDALGERGQFLPLEPARGLGTVGGLIAAAPEGSLALGYGGVRDRLIGLKVALADGTIAKGGGRVVKNVAGYALHRLMIGSLGTLGVVVEASFKVQPLPETSGSVLCEFDGPPRAFQAARLALDSGMEPVFANVLLEPGSCALAVGFDGSRSRVAAHLEKVAACVAPARPVKVRVLGPEEHAALRRALDDPFRGADAFTLLRAAPPASVRANAAAAAVSTAAPPSTSEDGDGTARRGTTEDPRRGFVVGVTALPSSLEEVVRTAREAALAEGVETRVDVRPGLGSAYLSLSAGNPEEESRALASLLAAARGVGSVIVRAAPRALPDRPRAIDPWGPPPEDFFLMQRIKSALDPDGLFARGGFVGGL